MSVLEKIKSKVMTPHELLYLNYRKKPMQHKTILLEGTHGRGIEGHIYALALYLKENFTEYKVLIAVRKSVKIPDEFAGDCIEHMSRQYLYHLATAEILINDTSFWSFFHKRADQKYYIFWHGTPLKCLGKATQVQGYGNVQRNLASADKIFVNNVFTKDILARDFGIAEIVNTEFVVAPSPRNSILFDKSNVVSGRYVYMPTWRDERKDITELVEHLKKIDSGLVDHEELYVKLHPFEAEQFELNGHEFKHIKPFPSDQELYCFLATTEKLITDYSSIMFDFAVTGRPILLFTYDLKDYENSRGIYFSVNDLPFTKSITTEDLLSALREKQDMDLSEINNQFNPVDFKDGTELIFETLLGNNQSGERISYYPQWNGKKNILIYAYKFDNNGITNSLLNLLEKVDYSANNYILTWPDGLIDSGREEVVRQLPRGVHTFIESGKTQASFSEMIHTFAYMTELPADTNKVGKMYQRDFDRLFPNLPISTFVHYPGYDRSYAVWTWALKPLGIKTMIFVHTDMEQEFRVNKNLKKKIIYESYRKSNHVVCVSKSIGEKVKAQVSEANITVMNVLINPERIRKLAEMPLPEDIPQRLMTDFCDDRIKVFINVGRFSKQKGLDRLISAFDMLENTNTRLLIIGSYGPEEAAIRKQVEESKRRDDIYLFSKIDAPYNFIAAADCFVFSSRYEGYGMVVFESLAVGTPVVMTEVPETVEALGGRDRAMVVENSIPGLRTGMEDFLRWGLKRSLYDFKSESRNVILIWTKLLRD